MKMGRPTKYSPEYCEIAEAILSDDKPICEVARLLRVHTETMSDWKKKYPDFSAAYKRGRAAGQALFMAKMNAAAWGADTHKVNNGLIYLLAINKYKMLTRNSGGKKKVDMSGTLSMADAVRRRHESNCGR